MVAEKYAQEPVSREDFVRRLTQILYDPNVLFLPDSNFLGPKILNPDAPVIAHVDTMAEYNAPKKPVSMLFHLHQIHPDQVGKPKIEIGGMPRDYNCVAEISIGGMVYRALSNRTKSIAGGKDIAYGKLIEIVEAEHPYLVAEQENIRLTALGINDGLEFLPAAAKAEQPDIEAVLKVISSNYLWLSTIGNLLDKDNVRINSGVLWETDRWAKRWEPESSILYLLNKPYEFENPKKLEPRLAGIKEDKVQRVATLSMMDYLATLKDAVDNLFENRRILFTDRKSREMAMELAKHTGCSRVDAELVVTAYRQALKGRQVKIISNDWHIVKAYKNLIRLGISGEMDIDVQALVQGVSIARGYFDKHLVTLYKDGTQKTKLVGGARFERQPKKEELEAILAA